MPSTTLSCSNNVIHLAANRPDPEPKGFAPTRERWLSRWCADRRLTHSERALCTQIYLHFNYEHFEKTGDLLAWPSWQTIMAATGLSESSVFRRLLHLERLGAFEAEHGLYNHQKKKRAGNRYLVRKSNLARAQGREADQPCTRVPDQPCTGARRLDESDSVINKEEDSKFGNSRGPSAPEKDPQPLLSDSDLKTFPRSTCGIPAADGPARPLRLIVPGSADMGLVRQYEAGHQRFWRGPDGSCLLTEAEYAAVNGGGTMAVSS